MQVLSIKSLTFKRQLKPKEEAEFSAVLAQGREKVGNTGHSILIVPSSSLPQSLNSGVGNLLDSKSLEFFDFAKKYWGINYVQLLPEGRYFSHKGNRFLPYSGAALDLGTQLINLELLTDEKFAKLISKEDVETIVKKNSISNREKSVNFENILQYDSPNEKILRKAYDELLKADTDSKQKLLDEIRNYKEVNKSWLEPKSIYQALALKNKDFDFRNWNEFDQNIYNIELLSPEQRKIELEKIRNSEFGKECGFFEFKQYLAESHFKKAKKELNDRGLKLSGDMLVGFSLDEQWANPKAFHKNWSLGWGLPVLNYDTPEGEKLLREKVKLFAERYDGLRIDSSWSYPSLVIEHKHTKDVQRKYYGSKILDIIDEEILKVKGSDYNLDNVMHEFITDTDKFNIYDGSDLKPYIEKRNKIYCTNYLHENWGSVENFRKRGWKNGSYVLGVTNHDCLPMRTEFLDVSKRDSQADVLAKILKIPREKLSNLNEFIKAKFAEPIRSKHHMIFFADALNLNGIYQGNEIKSLDYRLKIPTTYQRDYFSSLQNGESYNVMDALEKAFVAEGLDKKEPKLYKKITKYKKILQSPEKNKKLAQFRNLGIGIALGVLLLIVYLKSINKKEPNKTAQCKDLKISC